MSNLDKRISQLEQTRQPSAGLDVRKMTDAQLISLIRSQSPQYAHMSDSELVDYLVEQAGHILQQFQDMGIHPDTVTADEWQAMNEDNHHGQ